MSKTYIMNESDCEDFGLQVPTAKGLTMHVHLPVERFVGHAVLLAAEQSVRAEPPPPVILLEDQF